MVKKSRISFQFFALLFSALLSSALQAEDALLWRVETEQGAVSHLFGTIHSEDLRVTRLPEPVAQAFGSAETVVLEMELTAETQQKMAEAILLPPTEQLSDYISTEVYRDTVSAMSERGYPEEITSRLRPWAALMILSMPQPETGQFIDKILYDRALEENKSVRGLESVDEQLAAFRQLSLEDHERLLEQALLEQPELPGLMEDMTNAWLMRDVQALVALSNESLKPLPDALQERFMDALVR
ncbi:MAG: TraB/GumN family protein, partial [Pseudomonadota bacterium]